MGIENSVTTMENSLAGPQKAKHRVAIWPRNFTPQYIFKRIENKYSHRSLNMNIYTSKMHNSQEVDTTQISTE